jgi:alpha/beta superfamily hydrolase
MSKNSIHFSKEGTRAIFPGPAGALEIATTWPSQEKPLGIAVICHPHPLYGGTMDNKVITTLAKTFDQLGYATVRFNYRGVGKSEGSYGHYEGEQADLKAILTELEKMFPDYPLVLAGFSFGGCVAIREAHQRTLRALITVAPAVHNHPNLCKNEISVPWLMIQGDQDEVVPTSEVLSFVKEYPRPIQLCLLEGATHFFHGRLGDVAQAVKNFLSSH